MSYRNGAEALGGRGGNVHVVSNLANSGPGSLRAAVEARGPRTIVFHVGGTITLESPLVVDEPFVTIAGQTAPGGGVAMRHDGSVPDALVRIRTHDVIIDHVSLSWAVDEVAEIWGRAHDVTVQWSIIAERLACSNHEETINGSGGECPDGIIDHPEDVGGWPTLVAGSSPADTDGDGMPDAREQGDSLGGDRS